MSKKTPKLPVVITVSLPQSYGDALIALAEDGATNQSQIIRTAIGSYLRAVGFLPPIKQPQQQYGAQHHVGQ